MSALSPNDLDPAPQGPGANLRAHGDRIERLLDDIRAMVGPPAWQRVEELVRLVVELYGAGLERVLGHAAEAGGDRAALEGRLCDDELVSSLLLLHGLHPVPTAERVRRAIEAVRARLGADVKLLAPAADGLVRVRLAPAGAGCPSSEASLARAIEEAVHEAAPEVVRVEVEGDERVVGESHGEPLVPPSPSSRERVGVREAGHAATERLVGDSHMEQGIRTPAPAGSRLVTIGPPRGGR